MDNQIYSGLTDEQLERLREFTTWLTKLLLDQGVARDDLHKRIDDILKEQLKRLE